MSLFPRRKLTSADVGDSADGRSSSVGARSHEKRLEATEDANSGRYAEEPLFKVWQRLAPGVARIRVYLPALSLPTPKSDLPFST